MKKTVRRIHAGALTMSRGIISSIVSFAYFWLCVLLGILSRNGVFGKSDPILFIVLTAVAFIGILIILYSIVRNSIVWYNYIFSLSMLLGAIVWNIVIINEILTVS